MASSATLNLRISPRRMLTEREAAEYCGRPIAKFKSGCPVAPIAFPDGAKLYDLRDLDAWLDGLKGPAVAASVDELIANLE